MSYVIGIDTSTTATKALLVDRHGTVVAAAASTYGFETPQPLWSEQHPDLWWAATIDATRTVLAQAGVDGDSVAAVGLTGQMHGFVALDSEGTVLRNALLWNDQRTADECDEIRARVGAGRLIEITGNDALTGFTSPKILWMRNHEPELFARLAHVLLPKDYVRWMLTGDFATDKAGAAGTGLFDVAARDWSQEVLSALELDPSWFAKTHEGPDVTGVVSDAAATATGIAAGTPVVAGGGDQSANAVGLGAVSEGVVALSLGTSGVVFAPTEQSRVAPGLHTLCHALPDTWHLMGVMLSAAGALRWYRDVVAANASFSDLDEEAASVDAGADGLIFLPYLTGERTPHADPYARGAFVGLTVRHERRHMTRAVMEGVAFGLRDNLDLMRASGLGQIDQIRASGGGMASGLWRQIIADVLGVEIATTSTTEGAAYGAALLAAVGAKWHPSVEAATSDWVMVDEVTVPAGDARSRYVDAYGSFRALYPALQPLLPR